MDSKGRNVIVCDNGTGVRIKNGSKKIHTEKIEIDCIACKHISGLGWVTSECI